MHGAGTGGQYAKWSKMCYKPGLQRSVVNTDEASSMGYNRQEARTRMMVFGV